MTTALTSSVGGFHSYVHVSRPIAGCHVAPPSTDTSTLPTTPPPLSAAVPLIFTTGPTTADPSTGDTILETGDVLSCDGTAGVRLGCRFPGWTPMSANRFTVACCTRGSSPRGSSPTL